MKRADCAVPAHRRNLRTDQVVGDAVGDPVHLSAHAGAAALEVCAIVREDEPMGLDIGHTAVEDEDEVLNVAGTPYHSIGVDGRPGDIFGEELSKLSSIH